MRRLILGIDVGGTKINAAVIDTDGKILGRARAKTQSEEGADAVFRRIADTGSAAISEAGAENDQLEAVGVGSPGPLDWQAGVIIESGHLSFHDFPLGPRLAEEYGCPVFVDNDVNVGTYAEYKAGAARGASDVLGVFVGTGIGGGIIIDGSLYHGFSKNAGEVGHLVIKAGGPKCNCGSRGCLEALASRTAIVRGLRKAVKNGEETWLTKHHGRRLENVTSSALKTAFHKGDDLVEDAVLTAARYIGVGVGSLINLLGPEVVVLGGGVLEALGDEMMETIERAAAAVAFRYSMNVARIVRSALGDDAGVIGASLIARERLSRTGEAASGKAASSDL